jgi:IS5 family transposase
MRGRDQGRAADLERVIVDSTVQSKAIAHPVDSRLLEIARHKVVSAARRAGIACKQTYAKEGKTLRRKAGGYAHAKQFKRLRKTVKRQHTILGVIMREVRRKLDAGQVAVAASGAPANEPDSPKALSDLAMWLQRAECIRTQQRNSKSKLYGLHAPEVECISKGKARNPYEFGVKVSLVVTHKQGLMVGAPSLPGNPYDGHVLSAQLEQKSNLLQDFGRSPKQVIVDLSYRGVDADNPGVQIIHRGKYKSLTDHEKRLLKRRQAIEPLIGHTKADHRVDRCWLHGAMGDALHALSCAAPASAWAGFFTPSSLCSRASPACSTPCGHGQRRQTWHEHRSASLRPIYLHPHSLRSDEFCRADDLGWPIDSTSTSIMLRSGCAVCHHCITAHVCDAGAPNR